MRSGAGSAFLIGVAFSVTALAAGSAVTEQQSVTIHIVLPKDIKQDVRVTASNESSTSRTPKRLVAPGDITMELGPGAWTVRVESDGLWADDAAVTAGQTVTVEMLPAGVIHGQISSTEKVVSATAELLDERGRIQHQATCPIANRRLSCIMPVGKWDLRLRVAPYSPAYVSNVSVAHRAERSIGEVVFRPGGSVVGRVETPDAKAATGATVRLQTGTHSTDRRTSTETTVNNKGYFRFSGVEPGVYTLNVTAAGFAPLSVTRVTVRAGLEARLRDDLRLSEPVTLSLSIKPRLDAYGRAWQVQLMRSSGGAVGAGGNWQSATDPDGSWRQQGLATGDYTVIIGDSGGNRWFNEQLQLTASTDRSIEIKTISVEGKVTEANAPAVGTVYFGGQSGMESVQIPTDGAGNFQGGLPRDGSWHVEFQRQNAQVVVLKPVDVRVGEGHGAVLELRLPSGSAAGTVVDTSGAPTPGATVQVLTEVGVATANANQDGSFLVSGLSAGEVDISAAKDDRSSKTIHLSMSEAQTVTGLRLIIEADKILRGRVLAPSGSVAGANVAIWPNGGGMVQGATTNAEGYFSCDLPQGAASLNTAVYAVGFGMVFHEQRVIPDGDFVLTIGRVSGRLSIRFPNVRVLPMTTVTHGSSSAPLLMLMSLMDIIVNPPADQPTSILLSEVEPGDYTVCAPAPPKCASGNLVPNGELLLTVP